MKKSILSLLFLLCGVITFAQGQPLKITDLNIPTSPAFVFLDKSPANIERPNNPKALSLSLLGLNNASGAVEFTPYWFTNRPAYTFEDNVRNTSPILQTLALSIATTKLENATFLSGGFRTQLFRVYSEKSKQTILSKKAEIVRELSNGLNINENRINELKAELNTLKRNTSFVFEIAGAYAGTANDNKTLQANKYGAWTNIKWRPNNFPLDFTALARYTKSFNKDVVTAQDTTYSDVGLNISYAEESFDLQAEWVNRNNKEQANNYNRFVFIANYQILPGTVLVASFGKDFGEVQNIYSALGIKFSLSKEKMRLQ